MLITLRFILGFLYLVKLCISQEGENTWNHTQKNIQISDNSSFIHINNSVINVTTESVSLKDTDVLKSKPKTENVEKADKVYKFGSKKQSIGKLNQKGLNSPKNLTPTVQTSTIDLNYEESTISETTTKRENGRSINVDKYVSSEFHNKNNVYNFLTSPNKKDISNEDNNSNITYSFRKKSEFSNDLTTPKSVYFDNKHKKIVKEIQENLSFAEFSSTESVFDSEENETNTQTHLDSLHHKQISLNITADGHHKQNIFYKEEIKNIMFNSTFNNTETIDEQEVVDLIHTTPSNVNEYVIKEPSTHIPEINNQIENTQVNEEFLNSTTTPQNYVSTKSSKVNETENVLNNSLGNEEVTPTQSNIFERNLKTTPVPQHDLSSTEEVINSTTALPITTTVTEQIVQENNIIQVKIVPPTTPKNSIETTTFENINNISTVTNNEINNFDTSAENNVISINNENNAETDTTTQTITPTIEDVTWTTKNTPTVKLSVKLNRLPENTSSINISSETTNTPEYSTVILTTEDSISSITIDKNYSLEYNVQNVTMFPTTEVSGVNDREIMTITDLNILNEYKYVNSSDNNDMKITTTTLNLLNNVNKSENEIGKINTTTVTTIDVDSTTIFENVTPTLSTIKDTTTIEISVSTNNSALTSPIITPQDNETSTTKVNDLWTTASYNEDKITEYNKNPTKSDIFFSTQMVFETTTLNEFPTQIATEIAEKPSEKVTDIEENKDIIDENIHSFTTENIIPTLPDFVSDATDNSLIDYVITTTANSVGKDITIDSTTVENFEQALSDEEENNGTLIAICISSVGGVCLVLLIILLVIIRKRQKRFNYPQMCKPVDLDSYNLDNVSVYQSVRKGTRASKRSYGNPAFDDPVTVSNPLNFQALAKFSKLENIKKEYEEIPQVTARTTELPEGCESKNRYANVIPLPETRVFLKQIENVTNSDYINANYVTGVKGISRHYIACQAPMINTVDDFWRMVWEQQSKIIIMLTHLYENGVEKCADYLPPSEVVDCHRVFGDYQITLKKRDVKEKYIISLLQIKNMVSNSWREIVHLWYLAWPEKGVPAEANSIITFLLEARSYVKGNTLEIVTNDMQSSGNVQTNPVIVHCSPGTGRTGTVIACDIAIRSFELFRHVDIPKIVYKIRRDRASSVQTQEQYEFIYKVITLYASKLTGGSLDQH